MTRGRSLHPAPVIADLTPPIPAATNDVGRQTIGSINQEKLSLERERLLVVLHQTGGRIRGEGGAAQLLGVKPTTLEARLNRLGIKREHIKPP